MMQLPQQTAPYLEALTSYAFRDPTRFHVPGHKGGPGADAGLRHAIGEAPLTLDVAQGIEEIDTGPPPRMVLRGVVNVARLVALGISLNMGRSQIARYSGFLFTMTSS